MTIPTAREQLWEVHEKTEGKVCCELEVSVVVMAEPACWGPASGESYPPSLVLLRALGRPGGPTSCAAKF